MTAAKTPHFNEIDGTAGGLPSNVFLGARDLL